MLAQERTIASKNLDEDILRHEVSKLRRSVLDMSVRQGDRNAAYTSNFGECSGQLKAGINRGRSRAATASSNAYAEQMSLRQLTGQEVRLRMETQASGGQALSVDPFDASTASLPAVTVNSAVYLADRRPTTVGGVLSPGSSPYASLRKARAPQGRAFDGVLAVERVHSSHSFARPPAATTARFQHGTETYSESDDQSVASSSVVSLGAEAGLDVSLLDSLRRGGDSEAAAVASERARLRSRQQAKRQGQRTAEISSGGKSSFIGSGLGLKNDPSSNFSPKGSAKAMLKKILDQSN
jgi:hypothetical protein